MTGKKQYYGLDEIGFVGTQKKRTAAEVKKNIEKTTQFIKALKSGKVIPIGKRSSRTLSKAK